MVDDKVRLVKPGKTYFGAQGVAYGSGDDQDELIPMRELENVLSKIKRNNNKK